ncbi:protein croquemort-like [Sitophilus oryzae]|uniref:Protein croquemort-like n=1 Tax=Sitophilus oryzae TaxID=7048 RepID=A0A6J2Y1P9_SITOR|nr:protein croquemort-like [Sitophilus oryzae]
MELSANMQLNMLLQPIQGLSLYRNMPKIYMPIFYFSQTVELNDDLAIKLRVIQGLPDYLRYSSFFLIVIGIFLTIWAACLMLNFCLPSDIIKKYFPEEIPLNEKIVKM